MKHIHPVSASTVSVSPVPRSLFFRLGASLAALAALVWAPLLHAVPGALDDPGVGDIETARHSFDGIVNANSVFVRSGPTDSAYTTMQLHKGDRVTVVGVKLDWLKIAPPEGSFCYVGKLFVDRHGDGTLGRINKDKVNIRAGSQLNSMTYAILSEAAEGTEVTILGEHDEYYRIKPLPDAYLYVNKQYVDPDLSSREVKTTPPETHDPVAVTPPPSQPDATQPPAPVNPPTADGHAAPDTVAQGAVPMVNPPTTNPSTTQPASIPATPDTVATTPATQPAPADTAGSAEALFAKTEADFTSASSQPLEQQTVAPILASYQVLAASDKLPDSLRRVAESRVATLKARADAAEQLAEVHKQQEEMRHKQLALQAESKELEERLAKSGVSIYTAVGELHPSSLQIGTQAMYRLTDPATGRTVCYIRTNDSKFVNFMGQFVGVKGDLGNDPQLNLKVLTPTDVEAVDANKVNNGVSAQLIPPSLLPKAQASDQ